MSAPRSLGRRLASPEELWHVEPTTSGVTLSHVVYGQVVAVAVPQSITLDRLARVVASHDCPGGPDA